MTLDSCSLCCVLVSGFVLWFLVFDFHVFFISCLVVSQVLIFHSPLCPLSFSPMIFSLSSPFPPCMFVSPCLQYCSLHTLPLLSHLLVLVLVISVCVFSLCLPCTPCPVFAYVVSVLATVHICSCSCLMFSLCLVSCLVCFGFLHFAF